MRTSGCGHAKASHHGIVGFLQSGNLRRDFPSRVSESVNGRFSFPNSLDQMKSFLRENPRRDLSSDIRESFDGKSFFPES